MATTFLPAAERDWVVSCDLVFRVTEPALLALQIAAARTAVRARDERLGAATDGTALDVSRELAAPTGGRVHLLRAPAGSLTVSYRAELTRPGDEDHPADPGDDLPGLEQLSYLRPSRYCPSDHVVGLAVAEFGGLEAGRPRVEAVTEWIYNRVAYVPGSSAVHDSAEDTLLTGTGVCRDFAHLGITLCRALEIPARFVGVYAPGLDPMDFHAVFEAWIDGAWFIYDATRKVPRSSLVRIATGRDAADAAFASVLGGLATLETIDVTATVAGSLPVDDHHPDIRLP